MEFSEESRTANEAKVDASITYLILAHRSVQQIHGLIDRLDHPLARFVVHLDAKQSEDFTSSKQNVFTVTDRVCVEWGRFSMVEATLRCLRLALNLNHPSDFLILISGQHTPIRPPEELHRYLGRNLGRVFMNYTPIPSPTRWPDQRGGLDRIEHWYFQIGKRKFGYPLRFWRILFFVTPLIRAAFGNAVAQKIESIASQRTIPGFRSPWFKRKFPKGWIPYGGSQWWALPREIALRTISEMDQNQKFLKFFRFTGVPDELFFQSLILNRVDPTLCINDNLLFEDRTPCTAHAKTLSQEDLPRCFKSGKFFARKVDHIEHNEVQTIIDKRIKLQKASQFSGQIDEKFLRSLPDLNNSAPEHSSATGNRPSSFE